jgi:transforming growth factor-beta-induced protein
MFKVRRLTPLAAICFVSLTGTLACGDDDSSDPPLVDGEDAGDTDVTSNTDTEDSDSTTDNSSDMMTLPGLPDAAVMDGGDMEVDGGPSTEMGADGGDGGDTQDLPTIAALVEGNADFTVLASALADTGLDETLAGDGPYTVFAPTDEAFAMLPEGFLEALSNQELIDLLRYHVVEGSVDEDTVVTLSTAETMLEEDLAIQVTSEGVYLNGLTKLVMTDVETSNGVVHVIDSVLVPGPFPGTVADVVAAYPRLSILFGAASTEVNGELREDDVTLFAPVNEAFLGVDLNGIDDLDPILLHHVISDSTDATALAELRTARTAGGGFIGVKTSDGLQINDGSKLATVSYTDIEVASGEQGSTIHLIDEVLTPPGSIAEVAAELELTALVDALALASVGGTETTFAEALAGAGTFTVFAPSNDAFEAAPALGFGLDLANVLGAHAINGIFDSKAALEAVDDDGVSPETLTGSADNTLALSVIEETLVLNSLVQVTETDIPCSNGIIHLVDGVIVPSEVEFPGNIVDAVNAYPLLSSLAEATANAEDGDVAGALAGEGPFTLFAPINPAFEGVDTSTDLSAVLLYHAVSGTAYDSEALAELEGTTAIEAVSGSDLSVNGDDLTVNGAALLETDLRTTNGVIHVVGEVLAAPVD